MIWKPRWDKHPAIPTGQDLTFGQRCADHMRAGMGTWTFILLALLWMAVWITTGAFGWDENPYFRLNLALSCLAALQGAILLISAKRADQVASQLALHDYQTNVHAEEEIRDLRAIIDRQDAEITAIKELTVQVHGWLAADRPAPKKRAKKTG